jgi:SAM-dependent methyltransferase
MTMTRRSAGTLGTPPAPGVPGVGLFDFADYQQLAAAISEVLGLDAREVHERLFHEALYRGWNVSRAAERFGVTPHVYDAAMEGFYQQTDAFVLELAVVHLDPYVQEIDRRISEAIEAASRGAPAEILVLGDGIGTDSLRLALQGHRVTYFEFDGCSSAFARFRFERAGAGDRIRRVHRLADIPAGRFDVVVNREVLEHVERPLEVIEDIWRYLRPGGTAVVSESFGAIEPRFPTHLAESARYAGATPRLFVERGFRLIRIFPQARPVVFEKTTLDDRARFRTLPPPGPGRVGRLVRRVGRGILRRLRR